MITLRAVQINDADVIYRSWGRYPENFTFLTARVFTDVDDAKHYIDGLFPTAESKAFHLVHPENGIVGIVKAAITGHRAQIGYVVHRPFSGKGFATAAVQQITEILETTPGIHRIWATCAIENVPSARVLEKNGYEREAILKNWVTYPALGNRPCDNYAYVKIPMRSIGEPTVEHRRTT